MSILFFPTVVQYSCMGWVILWFLYLPPFPAKKHFWHMSKLKHFRQRYLQYRKFINHFASHCTIGSLSSWFFKHLLPPEAEYRVLLAYAAFCLVKGSLCRGEPAQQRDIIRSCPAVLSPVLHLCKTGSQTMLCGSCFIQLRKWIAWGRA